MALPSQFPFLHHDWEVIMYTNCSLDSVANLIVLKYTQLFGPLSDPPAHLPREHIQAMKIYQESATIIDWIPSLATGEEHKN